MPTVKKKEERKARTKFLDIITRIPGLIIPPLMSLAPMLMGSDLWLRYAKNNHVLVLYGGCGFNIIHIHFWPSPTNPVKTGFIQVDRLVAHVIRTVDIGLLW